MEYEVKEFGELATIRGHLEGYADILALDSDVSRVNLIKALARDAAKLQRISSELRKLVDLDA